MPSLTFSDSGVVAYDLEMGWYAWRKLCCLGTLRHACRAGAAHRRQREANMFDHTIGQWALGGVGGPVGVAREGVLCSGAVKRKAEAELARPGAGSAQFGIWLPVGRRRVGARDLSPLHHDTNTTACTDLRDGQMLVSPSPCRAPFPDNTRCHALPPQTAYYSHRRHRASTR